MVRVELSEARANLSQWVALAESGEDVLIARRGEPVARLTTLTKRTGHRVPGTDRVPGTWKGAIHIADDFDDEFIADEGDPPQKEPQ